VPGAGGPAWAGPSAAPFHPALAAQSYHTPAAGALKRQHVMQVIFARICGATSFFDDIWEGGLSSLCARPCMIPVKHELLACHRRITAPTLHCGRPAVACHPLPCRLQGEPVRGAG
jgi:hypothetical protein